MSKILPNIAAAQVAMQFRLRGYNNTVTTACAASTQALGDAINIIRLGRTDVMVAGGGEAGICELGLAAFHIMRALSTREDEPLKASRPFDRDRDGFVCAEGAALFVLESQEHAERRGARIIAELAGYGATSDAYHVVAPCVDGEGAQRAMREAIDDAGLTADDIDYVNAHGTSTPQNDAVETLAIKRAFGAAAHRVAVSSTKSQLGHLVCAAGGVEAIFCVKALESQILPPTINLDQPDPDCDLDYVPHEPRPARIRVALSNSFGFGGQNGTVIFRRPEESSS
jgi:3-oxoacyl-[acyl-carrier-protein] synthase II